MRTAKKPVKLNMTVNDAITFLARHEPKPKEPPTNESGSAPTDAPDPAPTAPAGKYPAIRTHSGPSSASGSIAAWIR